MCGGNVEKDNVSREGNKNYTGEGGANILQREIYGGRKSLFVEWEVEGGLGLGHWDIEGEVVAFLKEEW